MWRHEGDSFVTLFALGPLDGTSLVPLWLEFTPILPHGPGQNVKAICKSTR